MVINSADPAGPVALVRGLIASELDGGRQAVTPSRGHSELTDAVTAPVSRVRRPRVWAGTLLALRVKEATIARARRRV